MSDITFHFIGWQKDSKTNTDKVWVAFEVGNAYYAGWGRRGKSIRFKKHSSRRSLFDLMSKKKRDYEEVSEYELFVVFPTFEEDVAQQLTFSILADKVM